ncbi:hypothetical protein GPAL_0260 [Glaciecola pallidula DSM 14239 = ACAM 615]|uniref:Uncharacterized protein n=1 Tax=Brumicola pallidula DSM 14239 = ACAM 615 TaxID=1121922 RepID=K6YT27_9ALTE|nr:hypothetical protein GPAL_0260 [Glaciecola pallidula DSM 14239 = ACAM 615]
MKVNNTANNVLIGVGMVFALIPTIAENKPDMRINGNR